MNVSTARHPDVELTGRSIRIALTIAAVVVIAGLGLLRQSGVPSWNTIWAEDGVIFLSAAGRPSAVFDAYAGYIHLAPRLIAVSSLLVPADWFAAWFAAAAALVGAAAAVCVWWFARALVPSPVLRAVMVLAIVLHPLMVLENLASPAYLQWTLSFAAFWALLFWPRSRGSAAVAALVCAVAALTSSTLIVIVPVAALMIWKRRDRLARVAPIAFLVAVAIQAVADLLNTGTSPTSASHLSDLPNIIVVRVFAASLVGDRTLSGHWASLHEWIGLVSAVVVLGLLALLLYKTSGSRRCIGGILAFYSVASVATFVWLRGTASMRVVGEQYNANGARYASFGILLLLSAIFVLVSGIELTRRARLVVLGVVTLQFAVLAVPAFRWSNARSDGPAWDHELAEARAACREPGVTSVTVPITPRGWELEISCDRIE